MESGREEEFGLRFLSCLRNEGISYDFIGAKSRKTPFLGVVTLKKIIKTFDPDIVHSHLYWPLLFLMFIKGFPVIFTKHSIQFGAPKLLLRVLLTRVSSFVAICEACKKKFSAVAGSKIIQIDNGTSFKAKNEQIDVADPTVRLLYVGRLFAVKNIRLLLQACSGLSDLDFELRIAGEGPQLFELQSLVANLKIGHKVRFLGNVEDVSTEMGRSDIFLLSSVSEGLPISLIEASLSGLPCLVTDVGGCGEVITRCRNGFVVPSGDVFSYSQKLRLLIEDGTLRKELSHSAKQRSQHYSIDRAVTEHLNLYQTIL